MNTVKKIGQRDFEVIVRITKTEKDGSVVYENKEVPYRSLFRPIQIGRPIYLFKETNDPNEKPSSERLSSRVREIYQISSKTFKAVTNECIATFTFF